jgi:hypothetical protein
MQTIIWESRKDRLRYEGVDEGIILICNCVKLINLAQERDRWQAHVKSIINFYTESVIY